MDKSASPDADLERAVSPRMAESTAMAACDDSHAMTSLQSHLGDEDVHRSGTFTGVYTKFHRRRIRNSPRSPAIIQRADPGTVGNEEVWKEMQSVSLPG